MITIRVDPLTRREDKREVPLIDIKVLEVVVTPMVEIEMTTGELLPEDQDPDHLRTVIPEDPLTKVATTENLALMKTVVPVMR